MTNPFQLESLERLSPKDTYRNKVTGHGFGKFLLMMVQEFQEANKYKTDLFLECTTDVRYPYMMYRKLFFTHFDKQTPVPSELKKYHETGQNVHLLKFTISI